MIKIVGVFKVKLKDRFIFLTDLRENNKQVARCYFAFKEKDEWKISWTISNLNQLKKNIDNGLVVMARNEDIPKELLDFIEQRIKHDE